jgi:hypothetical protein
MTEAKELERKSAHTAWFRTVFETRGPRWERPWGAADSLYDAKSGGSAIVISYSR